MTHPQIIVAGPPPIKEVAMGAESPNALVYILGINLEWKVQLVSSTHGRPWWLAFSPDRNHTNSDDHRLKSQDSGAPSVTKEDTLDDKLKVVDFENVLNKMWNRPRDCILWSKWVDLPRDSTSYPFQLLLVPHLLQALNHRILTIAVHVYSWGLCHRGEDPGREWTMGRERGQLGRRPLFQGYYYSESRSLRSDVLY